MKDQIRQERESRAAREEKQSAPLRMNSREADAAQGQPNRVPGSGPAGGGRAPFLAAVNIIDRAHTAMRAGLWKDMMVHMGTSSGKVNSRAELKKLVRKLEVAVHPDKNRDNAQAATNAFQRISEIKSKLHELEILK